MSTVKDPTKDGSRGKRRRLLLAIAVALVAITLPHYASPYNVFQFTQVLVYFLAILSLCVLTGYSGQVSLGQSVFFAVGAYAAAITGAQWSLPLTPTFLLAFGLTFVLGCVIAVPALFMSSQYRVIVTLGIAVVTPNVLSRFADLTGGSQGKSVPAPEAPIWIGLAGDQYLYYIALMAAAVGLYVVWNLTRGRVKREMLAVKDNEIVARSLGIDTARTRILAFGFSAGIAALAGVVYALLVGYVTPGAFGLLLAINLLVGACIAGLRFIWGAIFGAAFLVYVPVYSAEVNDALGAVIFGVVVIVVSLFMPDGVGGFLSSVGARVGRRRRSAPARTDRQVDARTSADEQASPVFDPTLLRQDQR